MTYREIIKTIKEHWVLIFYWLTAFYGGIRLINDILPKWFDVLGMIGWIIVSVLIIANRLAEEQLKSDKDQYIAELENKFKELNQN